MTRAVLDCPAPAPDAAPWPLTEEHRRKAATVAAWAIDEAHAYALAYLDAMEDDRVADANREAASVAHWLDIAERADRLARPWGKP